MPTQTFDLETPDGRCDAFLATPDGTGPHPGVLFLMDAFGPREYLNGMAVKLAELGYIVLLPNLFYRMRRAPVIDLKFPLKIEDMTEARKQLGALFQSYEPEQGVRDAATFLEFLAKQPHVKAGPIGVVGYCMGGSLAVRVAARYADRIGAAASFHAGGLVADAPDSPHRMADRIKAELYVAHADNDQHMTPDQIERFSQALNAAHVCFEAETYKGAAHGFTMADLPAYNAEALERHWQKLPELFKRAL